MCKSTRTRLTLTALERRDAPTALAGVFSEDRPMRIFTKDPIKKAGQSSMVSALRNSSDDGTGLPIKATRVDADATIQVVYEPLEAEAESMVEKANHY